MEIRIEIEFRNRRKGKGMRKALLCLVFMLTASVIKGEALDGIAMISRGKSNYSIVYSATAAGTEKNAAKELAEHLNLVSGISFPIRQEGASLTGPAIYVGRTRFAANSGISFQGFHPEEWLVKAVGRNLVIGGGEPRGTLYGVWEFLERFVGIMWLDEKCTYLPKIDSLSLPGNPDLRGEPAFSVRGVALNKDLNEPEKNIRFMARNRLNFFHIHSHAGMAAAMGWGLTPIFGSPNFTHTFYFYTKEWPKEYENCLSMSKDGKRIRSISAVDGGQVCFSNPQTRINVLKKRELSQRFPGGVILR